MRRQTCFCNVVLAVVVIPVFALCFVPKFLHRRVMEFLTQILTGEPQKSLQARRLVGSFMAMTFAEIRVVSIRISVLLLEDSHQPINP